MEIPSSKTTQIRKGFFRPVLAMRKMSRYLPTEVVKINRGKQIQIWTDEKSNQKGILIEY
jgi:hypothetical protein